MICLISSAYLTRKAENNWAVRWKFQFIFNYFLLLLLWRLFMCPLNQCNSAYLACNILLNNNGYCNSGSFSLICALIAFVVQCKVAIDKISSTFHSLKNQSIDRRQSIDTNKHTRFTSLASRRRQIINMVSTFPTHEIKTIEKYWFHCLCHENPKIGFQQFLQIYISKMYFFF